MDRDLNAAKNLKQFYTSSYGEIHAFGDGSSTYEKKFSPSLN